MSDNSAIHAVVGIVRRENKVLIAERPEGKPYSGYWEFPGGKIEANETADAALKRELHEELGITVETAQYWFSHTHTYPVKTVILEMWFVDKFSGEPHSKENQPLRWVNFQELLTLRLLEGNWFIVDKMKQLFS